MTEVWFVLAAAGGGVGRHLISTRAGGVWQATLIVNVIGSCVLGALLRHDPSNELVSVVGVGACGAFTTFGGFALQSLEAPPTRRWLIVTANVCGSVTAATVGWWIA